MVGACGLQGHLDDDRLGPNRSAGGSERGFSLLNPPHKLGV